MDLDRLRADLTRDEDVRRFPYVDTVGKVSIGRGRNLSDRGLSEDEIEFIYNNDVTVAVTDLDRVAHWWRGETEARQRALCNMMFNLGSGRFLGFRRFLAAMQKADYETAADELVGNPEKGIAPSKWATQVGSRAHRIADLIRKG